MLHVVIVFPFTATFTGASSWTVDIHEVQREDIESDFTAVDRRHSGTWTIVGLVNGVVSQRKMSELGND